MIQNKRGEYCIRKRTEKGLLSGLYEFPWTYDDQTPLYPIKKKATEQITHTFTHFKLTLRVQRITAEKSPVSDGFFVPVSDFQNYPFSTLMRKVMRLHKR